jgi:hypothetical protein
MRTQIGHDRQVPMPLGNGFFIDPESPHDLRGSARQPPLDRARLDPPGQTVGIWLHHLVGLKDARHEGGLKWSAHRAARATGVRHDHLSKALHRIEQAGYITVTRRTGRNPLVIFQDVPKDCRCLLCTMTGVHA